MLTRRPRRSAHRPRHRRGPSENRAARVSDDRIGPYHVAIFTLCGACLIMDGFDVQAIGYVAPAIIQDWKIPAADMGPVFSAGLLGLFLGSLLFSMLGDRIGRRPVVLGATVVFSVLTLLTARVTSLPELIVMRVLAGLGLAPSSRTSPRSSANTARAGTASRR